MCIIFSYLPTLSIIDECGASIYSVSPAAEKEMPDLDPSLRGAGKYSENFITPKQNIRGSILPLPCSVLKVLSDKFS